MLSKTYIFESLSHRIIGAWYILLPFISCMRITSSTGICVGDCMGNIHSDIDHLLIVFFSQATNTWFSFHFVSFYIYSIYTFTMIDIYIYIYTHMPPSRFMLISTLFFIFTFYIYDTHKCTYTCIYKIYIFFFLVEFRLLKKHPHTIYAYTLFAFQIW